MTKIKKAENQPNFRQLEDKINQFWKENNSFEKSVEQRPKDNSFRFLDGPPFPNGTPHYGHLCWSVGKDVIPRFRTMKGQRVRRVFGWDCHGIAVETKVNKELGISSRKEIEAFGIENYVKECRKYVEKQIANWRWYIESLGRWVDMDNAYYTMYPEYHESVMWAFKQIWDKGYVYKGKRVSLYSVDTCTPVSDFEVAEANDYKDVEDLSVFPKFKLVGDSKNQVLKQVQDDVYVLAWTTTPWTLPSNFALAVNPEAAYVLVEFEGNNYILAKSRLEYTFQTSEENIGTDEGKLVKILKEFKGTELEGQKYEPLFNYFTEKTTENDYKVYLYDGVTIEDGTGVLHVAPGFGEEDFNLGKQFGLSDFSDIDEEGKMTVEIAKGLYLRDASPVIAEDLTSKGKLLRSEMYTHRLPFYRGNEPLIYMAQDQYFIDIQKIKKRMLELNENINWTPENVKYGRFPAVIESAPDWAVSRNRYWATIMPVWKSEDGEELVIGTFEEMMKYTNQLIKSTKSGGKTKYYLIKDVKKYEKQMEEYWEGNNEHWPDDVDFDDSPDFEVLSAHRDKCDGIVLKKDGKEFHRVEEVLDVWLDSGCASFAEFHYPIENKDVFGGKDFTPADFIIEGAGMVRAWFNVLHRVSTLIFDSEAFSNVICGGTFAGNDGRKMSKTYGNFTDPKDVLEKLGGETLRLYLAGSAVAGGGEADWSDEVLAEQQKNILIPIWNTYKYLTIYAELHDWTPENANWTSENVLDKWLESYMNKTTLEYAKALESYNIPASVKLIQPAIDNISGWFIRRSRDRFADGDNDALQTLYAALVQFIKTFAPQMPFLTEEIYQNIVGNVLPDAKESVHLEFYPEVDTESIDEKLLEEMEAVRTVCSLGNNLRVAKALKVRQPLAKAVVISKNDKSDLRESLLDIIKDELNVKEVLFGSEDQIEKENYESIQDNNFLVGLDTKLTEELKQEGLYAELKRQIQNARKVAGLQMGEEVSLELRVKSPELQSVVEKYKEQLKQDVSASEITFKEDLEGNSVKVGDEEVLIGFQKNS